MVVKKKQKTKQTFFSKCKAKLDKIEKRIFPRVEIMHYKLNKESFIFSLFAILFNALMFLHIYGMQSCKSDLLLGLDLVVNIVFMLFAFLCAENKKKYDIKAAYISLGLGALEIVRIFLIPLRYLLQNIENSANGLPVGDFSYVTVLLVVSAALLIVSGLICIRKTKKLHAYVKSVEEENKQ